MLKKKERFKIYLFRHGLRKALPFAGVRGFGGSVLGGHDSGEPGVRIICATEVMIC